MRSAIVAMVVGVVVLGGVVVKRVSACHRDTDELQRLRLEIEKRYVDDGGPQPSREPVHTYSIDKTLDAQAGAQLTYLRQRLATERPPSAQLREATARAEAQMAYLHQQLRAAPRPHAACGTMELRRAHHHRHRWQRRIVIAIASLMSLAMLFAFARRRRITPTLGK